MKLIMNLELQKNVKLLTLSSCLKYFNNTSQDISLTCQQYQYHNEQICITQQRILKSKQSTYIPIHEIMFENTKISFSLGGGEEEEEEENEQMMMIEQDTIQQEQEQEQEE